MFVNTALQAVIDVIACYNAGILAFNIGTKNAMTVSYAIATVGGGVLLFAETEEIILISLVLTRFGVDCAYTLTYALTSEEFPSSLSARVFGLCTLSASVWTIMSPLVAEIKEPVPILSLVSVCSISTIGSYILSKQKNNLKDFEN